MSLTHQKISHVITETQCGTWQREMGMHISINDRNLFPSNHYLLWVLIVSGIKETSVKEPCPVHQELSGQLNISIQTMRECFF